MEESYATRSLDQVSLTQEKISNPKIETKLQNEVLNHFTREYSKEGHSVLSFLFPLRFVSLLSTIFLKFVKYLNSNTSTDCT